MTKESSTSTNEDQRKTTTPGGLGVGRRSHYKMPLTSSSSSKSSSTTSAAAAATRQQQRRRRQPSVEDDSDDEPLIPRKIKLKANPIRDIGIFVGFIIFMFILSYVYKDVGKAKSASEADLATGKKSQSILNARQIAKNFRTKLSQTVMSATGSVDRINPVMVENIQAQPRTDCSIFLHKSTIPGQYIGLSFFAGQNYNIGDDIMNLGQPVIKMDDDDEFHNNTTTIPPPLLLAMLLKNHPLLHNVKSTSTSKTVLSVDDDDDEGSYYNNLASSSSSIDSVVVLLKATQPIFKGQELFLHPSDVYYYRNPNIPTLDDYKEADTLIKEERVVFKVSDSKKRTAHYKKRIPEIGIGLRMTQKAVSKYSPRVSALLPIMADQLLDYNFGKFPGKESLSAILSLKNYTYDYLTEYGVCMSDVEFTSKSKSSNNNKNDETSVTIQNGLNQIPKGKRIVPIPLYVTTTTKTALNTDDNTFGFGTNCLYHQSSIMVICPMIPLEYNIVVSSSGGGDGDGDGDTFDDDDDDANLANAKLQWSIWNPIDATIKEPDVVLEKYSTELTWDAIASKDLIPGEKIVVSVEKDPSTGMLLVPNELFPEKWIRNSINNDDDDDDVEANKSSNNCVDDNCYSNDQHMEGDVEQRVEL